MNDITKRQSRTSFAHEDERLRDANPMVERAPDVKAAFEAERREDMEAFKAMRRGSSMVQRQQPVPELKPSPEWADDVKAETFEQDWQNEARQANRANRLAEAHGIKRELEDHRTNLSHEDQNRRALVAQAEGGDGEGASKEAFKLLRRIHEESARVLSKSRTFRHSVGGF